MTDETKHIQFDGERHIEYSDTVTIVIKSPESEDDTYSFCYLVDRGDDEPLETDDFDGKTTFEETLAQAEAYAPDCED